jgi:hypothetical protein
MREMTSKLVKSFEGAMAIMLELHEVLILKQGPKHCG